MTKPLLLGCHVSMKGDKMLLGSSEDALSYGASTFMIYTGAPQNTRRKPVEELNIEAGREHMAANGLSNIVVHAPYIINLANTTKAATFELAVDFLQKEIERTAALGFDQIVLHPGAHVGAGVEKGTARIIEGLNEVLSQDFPVRIALETMAGKGTEIGRNFDEIARIIDGVTHNERLSVCFDTCHVHDSGYDIVNDFDEVLRGFDETVGKERISVIHVNDSKNERGAMKDRHENLGFGHIGFDPLNYIVHHPTFENIPKILETPFVGADPKKKSAPYKFEIEMLKTKEYQPDKIDLLRV